VYGGAWVSVRTCLHHGAKLVGVGGEREQSNRIGWSNKAQGREREKQALERKTKRTQIILLVARSGLAD
jgi:hypothetical protein